MSDQGDLPRALRFAVSHIQPGSTGPTSPMSDQDREWLSEVIGTMASPTDDGVKDPEGKPKYQSIADVLKSFVVLLEKNDAAHFKESVGSELQHIAEESEIVDRADDCERKNSVHSIKMIFAQATKQMLAPICSILAELAQNSPGCQSEAMPLIPTLIEIIKDQDNSAKTKSKALYALSAIIRGNPSHDLNSYLFRSNNDNGCAIDVLVQLICEKREAVSVRTKAAFLLNCLVSEHEVRNYLFTTSEKQLLDLREDDENIKELVDGIKQSIQTRKLADDKPPLALKM